jgi:hypothetical protein
LPLQREIGERRKFPRNYFQFVRRNKRKFSLFPGQLLFFLFKQFLPRPWTFFARWAYAKAKDIVKMMKSI